VPPTKGGPSASLVHDNRWQEGKGLARAPAGSPSTPGARPVPRSPARAKKRPGDRQAGRPPQLLPVGSCPPAVAAAEAALETSASEVKTRRAASRTAAGGGGGARDSRRPDRGRWHGGAGA
jgi:hypothetical protein